MSETTEKTVNLRPLTKPALVQRLVSKTALERAQVQLVLEKLGEVAAEELGPTGPGIFLLHGLVKASVITKPAVEAGSKPHPFKKGETMQVKARPETKKVKVKVLADLKKMAQ